MRKGRVYIMDMKLRYKYFVARLRHEVEKLGHGGKSYIGKNIGKSGSFIGQIVDPNTNKKASVDTQIAIAEFISGSEEKFIQEGMEFEEFGVIKDEFITFIKQIKTECSLLPESPPTPISLQDEADKKHQIVIEGFKDKERAIRLNQKLVELEKLSPEQLDTVESMLNGLLLTEREKKGLSAIQIQKNGTNQL